MEKQCPRIERKTEYVYGEGDARRVFTVRGGFPHGITPEMCNPRDRYVYCDDYNGTTYAMEFYGTEQAARDAWHARNAN